MEIEIGSKWKLSSDESCVTISERQVVKSGNNKGRVSYMPRWYYPNIETALTALVDRDIQGLEKLEYVNGRMDELKKDIVLGLEGINKTTSQTS